MREVEKQVIRLERDGEDRLIPKGFLDILVHRFLPVLALSYIASVVGIAANKGDVYEYLLRQKIAYEMALFVVFWVSVPSIVWIFIKSNPLLTHLADFWYRIIAALMIVTTMLSLFLFPEAEIYGLRVYLALSIPIFLVIYLLFIKDMFPRSATYPLNALGFCVLVYGFLIGIVF